MSDVTRMLGAIQHGDGRAADELLPLVYDELRKLAAHKMANEVPGQTLQPTALVHEAWLRLVGNEDQKWNGRAHFFGAAAGKQDWTFRTWKSLPPAQTTSCWRSMTCLRSSPRATNRRLNWSNSA